MPKDTIDHELEHVLSRATALYPKLVARRAAIAGELATIEAALARLDRLSGSMLARGSTRVGSKSGPTKLTPKKLEEPVFEVLERFSAPVGSARIMEVLHAEGIPVAVYPLQMALKRLRDQGRVRATGEPKRFLYEIVSGRSKK